MCARIFRILNVSDVGIAIEEINYGNRMLLKAYKNSGRDDVTFYDENDTIWDFIESPRRLYEYKVGDKLTLHTKIPKSE